MSVHKQFEEQVKAQALQAGYSEELATAMAAQAVLDRVATGPAGFAVAETKNFTMSTVYELNFEISDYRVDQSEGGVLVDAVLMDTGFDVIDQAWDASAFNDFAMMINAGGIHGYIDEHGEFRATKQRDATKSVTEWVRARVEQGKLYITTKLKEGFEWVADRFRAVSVEAIVPKSKARVENGKRIFSGGEIKGFVFTNKPKNPSHRAQKIS